MFQISINGEVHEVGTVVRVSNHYMVGIVLGILAALVAGAVLAFVVMKHLRKKKKGELCSVTWTLALIRLYNRCRMWVEMWNKPFNRNVSGVALDLRGLLSLG